MLLRETVAIALAIVGLCGPARAGVLSAADIQRLRDYEQLVIPADRELPALRDMGARIDALIAMADGEGASRSDFRSIVRELPAAGGPALERRISSLKAIDDPGLLAPPEWTAMLTETKAELGERLAYDGAVLKAYQRSVAAGAPGLGPSFVRWEERPDAAAHWRRFQAALDRARKAAP